MLATSNLVVDRERLLARLNAMAQIGATAKGGVHRLALSDTDAEARTLLAGWAADAGYPVTVDAIGNMFATRPGRRAAGAPPLMLGSHLDSQPYAGRFDGPVGVLTALEVMQALDDRGIETRTRKALASDRR